MSKTVKILLAYAAGQATQLVIHGMALSFNMWNNRQIPFCMAAGFVLLFALIAGVYIARKDEGKPAHEKTYKDWAKVPGKTDDDIDEVVLSANKK